MSCRIINGQLYYCNGKCPQGSIWGTNPYTSDTNPCTAARHSGQINEGYFVAEKQPGLQIYSGSMANGINSSGYGPYSGSIKIRVASIQEINMKEVNQHGVCQTNIDKLSNEIITLKQSSEKQTEQNQLIIISLNQKINIQENQILAKDQEIQSLNQKFQDDNKDLLYHRNIPFESNFLLFPILQKFEGINNRYLQNERKKLDFKLPSIQISDISNIQYEASMQYLLKFSQNLLEELNNKYIDISQQINGIILIKDSTKQNIAKQNINFSQIMIEQIFNAFDTQSEDLNQSLNNLKDYEYNIKELMNELDKKQNLNDEHFFQIKNLPDSDEQVVIKQKMNSQKI